STPSAPVALTRSSPLMITAPAAEAMWRAGRFGLAGGEASMRACAHWMIVKLLPALGEPGAPITTFSCVFVNIPIRSPSTAWFTASATVEWTVPPGASTEGSMITRVRTMWGFSGQPGRVVVVVLELVDEVELVEVELVEVELEVEELELDEEELVEVVELVDVELEVEVLELDEEEVVEVEVVEVEVLELDEEELVEVDVEELELLDVLELVDVDVDVDVLVVDLVLLVDVDVDVLVLDVVELVELVDVVVIVVVEVVVGGTQSNEILR